MGLEIIDPNDINFATVPEYERGFIFADLVATRRGNTNLGTANQESVTVSFLGYDQRKGREGDFSTRYSYLNLDETKDNIHEGFGITNIKIETNSSYVPKVVIEMVDIRGATLFNKGASSPYAILMDFPPPLFELTVKGYYGKPLAYKLHLVRQNSTFNSENGNMTITAEFIASTYGILADIPIGYLLTMPFMDKNYDITSLENSSFPVNTFELIYKFKSLFEKIDKIQNDSKITETNATATVGLENVDAYYELMNEVSETRNYGVDKTNPNTIEIILPNQLSEDEKKKKLDEKVELIKKIREKITTDITDNADKSVFKGFDVNSITIKSPDFYTGISLKPLGTYDFLTTQQTPILSATTTPLLTETQKSIIDFTTLITKLKSTKTELETVKTDNENKIAGEAEKASVELFGEQKPTVGKIFEIICKDIDVFMSKINTIGREADTHHETNKAEIIKVASGYANMGLHNNSKIYPFPTITSTENNGKDGKAPRVRSKGYIGQLFKDFNPEFPEYKFVEDFIQATLDKAKKEDSFDKQDGVNEKTDEAFWLPMSPIAVGFDGKLSKCPYIEKTSGQDLMDVFIARISAVLGYVLGVNSLNSKEDNSVKIINSIIKIEAENLFALVNDDKIFAQLNEKTQLIDYLTKARQKLLASPPLTEIMVGSDKEFYDASFPGGGNVDKGLVDEVSDTLDDDLKKPFQADKFSGKDDVIASINSFQETSFFVFKSDSNEKLNYITNSRGIFYLEDKKLSETNGFRESIYKIDYDYIFKNVLCEYKIDSSLLGTDTYTETNKAKIIKAFSYLCGNFEDKILKILENSSIIEVPPILLAIIGGAVQDEIPDNVGLQMGFDLLKGKSVRIANLNNKTKTITKKYFDDFLVDLKTFRDSNQIYKGQTTFSNGSFKDGATNGSTVKTDKELTKDFKGTDLYKKYFEKRVYYKINSAYLYRQKQTNSTTIPNCFFIDDVNEMIYNAIKDKKKIVEKEAQAKKAEVERKFENADVKQKLYQSFKSLYERWSEGRNINGSFEEFGSGLFSSFKFVDRAYNDISNECYISVKPLLNFENTPDSSMYSVISSLLSYNSFEFFPLQNFLEFTTDAWKEVFTIHDSQSLLGSVKAKPQFTCMYMGGTSSVLQDDLGRYKNDGFSLEDAPMEDFQTGNAKAFKVSWAKENQSIFKNIQLSTTEHRETNESLKILATISKDDSNTTPEPVGQNLFPIHEQRSYSCTVEMMGNVMIQPVQYFELKNIPMYSGAYMILDVTHTIIPNSMTTSFKGVRVAKFPNPLITNFLASNGIVGGTGGGQGGGQTDGEFFEGLGGDTIIHPMGDKYIKGATFLNAGVTPVSGVFDNPRVFNGQAMPHGGLDLNGESEAGVPIYAIADGVVKVVYFTTGDNTGGNDVRNTSILSNTAGHGCQIEHSGGYVSVYMHLESALMLKVGDKVLQGDKIGIEGNTGYSFGKHLHFELRKNGSKIDPLPYLTGKSTLNGLNSQKPNRSYIGGNSSVNGDFMVGDIPFSKYFTELQKKNKGLFPHILNVPNFQKWAGNSEKWSGRSKIKLNELIGAFTIVYNETGGLFISLSEQGTKEYIETATATKRAYSYKERGRGFIQITNKSNYEIVLKELGLKKFDQYTNEDLDRLFLKDDETNYGALKVFFNNQYLAKNAFDGLASGKFFAFGRAISGGDDYAKLYENRVKTIFSGFPKNTTLDNKTGNPTKLKEGENNVIIGGVSVTIIVPKAKKILGNIIALQGWGQAKNFWITDTSLDVKAPNAGYRLIIPDVKNTGYASQNFPETGKTQKDELKREWFTKTLIEGLQKDYGILTKQDNNFILGLSTGARGVGLIVMDKPGMFDACAVLSGDYDQLVFADAFMTQIYGNKAQNAQRWKSVDNIITRINSWKTPVYIGHGANDPQTPKAQSQTLFASIKKSNPKVGIKLNIASGQGHTKEYWDSEIDNMLEFFSNAEKLESL